MRTSVPIKIKIYYPATDTGQQELMRRVAEVHADFVYTKIQKLSCSAERKKQLTRAVVDTALGKNKRLCKRKNSGTEYKKDILSSEWIVRE